MYERISIYFFTLKFWVVTRNSPQKRLRVLNVNLHFSMGLLAALYFWYLHLDFTVGASVSVVANESSFPEWGF